MHTELMLFLSDPFFFSTSILIISSLLSIFDNGKNVKQSLLWLVIGLIITLIELSVVLSFDIGPQDFTGREKKLLNWVNLAALNFTAAFLLISVFSLALN